MDSARRPATNQVGLSLRLSARCLRARPTSPWSSPIWLGAVAAAVRGRRLDRGLSQSELAKRSGISRKWISEFEAGKTTVEFALVIRVLEALGLSLDLSDDPSATATMSATGAMSATASVSPPTSGPVDLDALLEEYWSG
jgi:HTH-type transcriptional regulator / antitoxin HipB